MYCIKCGVELADTEKSCPLCGTVVYHPDLSRPEGEPLYPAKEKPAARAGFRWYQVPLTLGLLLVLVLGILLCDLQIHRAITWSGYAIGGLVVGFVAVVLPGWFEKPNPVIFVPCAFAAALAYLLYIDLSTGGDWFLPFAFPVVGGLAIICETVATVGRYVRKGKLFLYGGASLALGGLCLLAEFLIDHTFGIAHFVGWSLYPLTLFGLLGLSLLFLGICRPAREVMEQKFFF